MSLKITNIEAGYDAIRVLKGVSLEVSETSIVALLGANGAGKTTTLRVISGILRPSSGTVEFEGQRLNRLSPENIVRLGIVQVMEGRRIFPNLTVMENLRMGAYVRKDLARVREDIDRVWAIFPILKERGRQLAGSLSGGEQQMLAIGRGLMARPRILLLDEPSLGLAPKLVTEIFKTIQSINIENGTSMLIVEQNAKMALGIADYGHVLQLGSIALSGPAHRLREDDKIVRSYLGRKH